MQLSRTKFRKSFILSTKKWIKCFPGKNLVNSREKSGDITCGMKMGAWPECIRKQHIFTIPCYICLKAYVNVYQILCSMQTKVDSLQPKVDSVKSGLCWSIWLNNESWRTFRWVQEKLHRWRAWRKIQSRALDLVCSKFESDSSCWVSKSMIVLFACAQRWKPAVHHHISPSHHRDRPHTTWQVVE